MEMKSTIGSLKSDISNQVGQKVIVKKSSVRGKVVEQEGRVEQVYSNFFRVNYEGKNVVNETYSYSDVITKTITVKIFDGQEYVPIEPVTMSFRNKTVALA